LDNTHFQAAIRALECKGLDADIFAAIACNDVRKVTDILKTDGKAGETKNQAGRVALHWAVTLDCKEIVKLLLDSGADPHIRSQEKNVGTKDETALHRAAIWDRLEIAEMLINHRANVNARDTDGDTPLHSSVYTENVELARLILKHGADVNAKNGKGETPLDRTAYSKNPAAIIKLLHAYGARK
jgi:ankyrin repeat protein